MSLSKQVSALWSDQGAAVSVLEMLLTTTVLVLGVVVGIVSYRNQVVQELADVGVALEHLDQSYTYTVPSSGGSVTSKFTDTISLTDPPGTAPAGMSLSVAPSGE